MPPKHEKTLSYLRNNPQLLDRMSDLLDIVNNSEGQSSTADQAEELTVEQIRLLGNELMHEWVSRRSKEVEASEAGKPKHEKKVLLAHKTWNHHVLGAKL